MIPRSDPDTDHSCTQLLPTQEHVITVPPPSHPSPKRWSREGCGGGWGQIDLRSVPLEAPFDVNEGATSAMGDFTLAGDILVREPLMGVPLTGEPLAGDQF